MRAAIQKYSKDWLPADYVLLTLLFVFPLYNKLMPSLLLLMGITLFWQRQSWKNFRRTFFAMNGPAFWSWVLFLVHLIGVSYSVNKAAAWEDVGMKFSLLALPILFSFVRLNCTLRQVLDVFLVGLLFTSMVMIGYAAYRTAFWPNAANFRYFVASDFTITMHRSYFAMYSSLGVLLAIYRLFVDRKWINLLWAAILLFVTVFTMSKAGFLILLLVLPFLLVHLALKIFNVKVLLLSLTALVLIAGFTLWQNETLRRRFGAMFAASKVETINNNSTEGNNVRVIMWATSMKLIKEHPTLGVGTGDVNDALNNRNHQLGNHAVANRNFNSHNQYLNTFVALGLPGFVALLMLFLSTIDTAMRKRQTVLLLFALVFALSLLFESMFETQAGLLPILLLLISLYVVQEKRT